MFGGVDRVVVVFTGVGGGVDLVVGCGGVDVCLGVLIVLLFLLVLVVLVVLVVLLFVFVLGC